MSHHLQRQLQGVLGRLEKAQVFIRKTQDYCRDERRLRMLTELIKEQMVNEDTRTPTREIR